MQEEEKEEKIIVLTDEITPPYDGSKRENTLYSKNLGFMNPALKGATEEYHKTRDRNLILGKNGVWKRDNYIIGKSVPEDKQYCEPVSPLDLHNTAEIRKYILAVEKFTTEKENQRSISESQNRLIKYVFCYVLGALSVLWALYAGMINLTQ